MTTSNITFDAALLRYQDLPSLDWGTLLLGNGYSINLWRGFSYSTLRGKAVLGPEVDKLFLELDTDNFEQILEVIHHAHMVVNAMANPTAAIDSLYEQARDALFQTIRSVHVAWEDFPTDTHLAIAAALSSHRVVFTTNYDLTAYWSCVHALTEGTARIADLFWGAGNTFDPEKVEVWPAWTGIYYLHGAIQLWQDAAGVNGKWTYADGGNLLGLAGRYTPTSSRRPLFVSEGTHEAKLRSIRRSEYLTHCYELLESDGNNTVIFGHSLGACDSHILKALARGPQRDIAVSVYPHQTPEEIIQLKARVVSLLPPHRVHFYDSESHPLGDPALNIG